MTERVFPRIGERYFEETLPNGLTVRIVPKKGFAKKRAFLAVNFGSVDTAFSFEGKTYRMPDGIAHYLEHKMFDLPEGDAMERFAQLGAYPNAFTSYDMTAYYFTCTEQFEENLRILLEMVLTPYFTEESVEKERGIIAQEIRMYEDNAQSNVSEALYDILLRHHPMRLPIAGTVEGIQAITARMLYDCYDAFYRPCNMMLCVVGEVDERNVIEIAKELSGDDCRPLPIRDYGPAESLLPRQALTEKQMEISMPTFSLGFRCAPSLSGMEILKRELVGDLAAEILAGESSPLYQRLYEAGTIDGDFTVGYESVKDICLLSMNGDSEDPLGIRDAILEEAERICREGIDEGFFRRLLRSCLGRRTRGLDSFEGICYRSCAYYFDRVDFFRFPETFDAVSKEDVLELLRESIVPERAALSIVRQKMKTP
ncbi:MAG: insulinase family protein [Oscillospiraceae bacterium]|nr:insulinase family protein [Oscillospiraceae bacterium]